MGASARQAGWDRGKGYVEEQEICLCVPTELKPARLGGLFSPVCAEALRSSESHSNQSERLVNVLFGFYLSAVFTLIETGEGARAGEQAGAEAGAHKTGRGRGNRGR